MPTWILRGCPLATPLAVAVSLLLGPAIFANPEVGLAQAPAEVAQDIAPQERLVILWTSGDPAVAEKMVFIYAYNARKYGWWQDITFIVWGPSAKLLAENENLQIQLTAMKDVGIDLKACQWCADQYGVAEKLTELGITVVFMGKELTDYIQEGRHVLTF